MRRDAGSAVEIPRWETVDPDREAFVRQVEALRGELLAYCYRMLGSVHDAEDAVQEVYVRAWRSYGKFEGRSTLRVWLYRIATNSCLTALERRGRRPLPSGLADPSADAHLPLIDGRDDGRWLQPWPDVRTDPDSVDPAAIVASRDGLRLALVAALQHLPARQRVVLILRDVLAWQTAEVAQLLGTSAVAVKSALQRAREHLRDVAPREDGVSELTGPQARAFLDGYMQAFENADVAALTRLLRADAEFEMPPLRTWFAGRDVIGEFLASRVLSAPGGWQMVDTHANGQPAFAVYRCAPGGEPHAHAIHVLTVTVTGISRIVAFLEPDLFSMFGLPLIGRPDSRSHA